MMRRSLLTTTFVLLGLAACFPKGWNPGRKLFLDAEETPFEYGPYLVRAAPDRMLVAMSGDGAEPPMVTWGAADSATVSAEVEARRVDDLWVAELEGLPPSRDLKYHVRSAAGDFGPARFIANRRRGERFRFAAFGDTRTGHAVHRGLIERMAREEVDFVIHSGDMVEFGGVAEQWSLFFRIEGLLLSRSPIFPAVGNHDKSPRRLYRRHFLTKVWAADKRYYFQDWGDVRVVAMDSEIEMRPGSEQYLFLEAALAEAAAANMLIVMSLHHPPYSSGSHGSNMETRAVLATLAPRFGVELVLAGHDHDYERTKPIDGVTYIVAASGGATIRPMTVSDFSVVLRTEPHYVVFDVEKKSLIGRTMNLEGNVFDSFVIPPNPPQEASR